MTRVAFASAACLALMLVSGCGGSGSGGSTQADLYGSSTSGLKDGNAATALFSNPANVAVGTDGSVYVADYDNNAVRRIAPNGLVTTVVNQSNFHQPFGLTVSSSGVVYVSTDANELLQKDATTGTVWKIDVQKKTATVVQHNLGRPRGLLALGTTKLVLTDIIHDTVSLLDLSSGSVSILAGAADQAGHVNDTGANARFSRPYGMAFLDSQTILVADANNNCIRKVTLDGVVTDFAGTTVAGATNGTASASTFTSPQGVALVNGDVYVADTGNHLVRRISAGQVTTEAGDGTAGFALGSGTSAEFYGLEGLAAGRGGGILWVADGNGGDGSDHNRVRKLIVP